MYDYITDFNKKNWDLDKGYIYVIIYLLLFFNLFAQFSEKL